MQKYMVRAFLVITTLLVGLGYGIVIHKYKVFPYGIIQNVYYSLGLDKRGKTQNDNYGPWSIGIYEGSTPFNLTDPEDVFNPVLSGQDVSDIDAFCVADPFMVLKDNKYYMFFEAVNRQTNLGVISYAESSDGKSWEYRKVVIEESFHLSYPYVFEWEGDFYMIPESFQDLSIRLYKATSFPEKWEYVGNMLAGYPFLDASIIRHNSKWWLFVSTIGNDILNLYYSDELLGEWKPHPENPIIKFNKHTARPAGRIITYNDRLYRFAQDDYPSYGIRVFAFEINNLTENSYTEKMVSERPVIDKTGTGWNAAGMHHIDLLKIGDRWLAVVDGRDN